MKRVKEESEKAGLKLDIQKTKLMASSPIFSLQIEWEKVEAVKNFIFLGSPKPSRTSYEKADFLPSQQAQDRIRLV